MRKLIVTNLASLDGYYEGPGNNVMVLPLDAAFDAYNLERLRAADTLLLGRATFEGFKGFWPEVVNDPKASETNREISRLDNAIDKVVGSQVLARAMPLHDRVLMVSGRVSFEIVQKAAVAGIPVVAAVSAPSDLAIEAADRLGVTLVGFLRGDGFNVYAHDERIDLRDLSGLG